jgi:hypothetical protein
MRLSILCVVGFIVVAPAMAQVVAEQGAAPASEFHSPMVLTVPIRNLKNVPMNSLFKVDGVSDYWVDGVQLRSLVIRRERDSRTDMRLAVEGWAFVRSSFDREVVVRFELLDETGAALATWTSRRFDAEERKLSPFRLKGSIPIGSRPTHVRLTVTVHS